MTDSHDEHGVEELIVRYLDGLLDDAASIRLAERLGGSDQAVALLVNLSVQRRMLRESLQYSASRLKIRKVSDESIALCRGAAEPRRRRWLRSAAAIAAAVALLVTIGAMWTLNDSEVDRPAAASRQSIGTVTAVKGVVWGDFDEPMIAGQALNHRVVSLTAGSMQLVTSAGVAVTLDGPGEFEMIDPMHAVVRRGTMVAIAPDDVVGFTIQSPGLLIRDLGTEFGVHVDEAGSTGLEVLDGRVEVTTLDAEGRTMARRVLDRWQAVRFDPGPSAALIDVAPQASYFADRRVMRAGFPGLSRSGRPAEPIRLDMVQLLPYANQDGYNDKPTDARLLDEPPVCRLSGNAWKVIAIDYDVTDQTVLEVEFRTIRPGEMVGAGVDNDNNVKTDDTLFALAGHDYNIPGINSAYHQTASQSWRTVHIRLGDHTRGLIRQLVIFADDDRHGKAVAEFRNLRLYEQADEADASEARAEPIAIDKTDPTHRQ